MRQNVVRWMTVICLMTHLYATDVDAKLSPGGAVALSIVPGLGQVANDNFFEGLGYFFLSAGGILGGSTLDSDFLLSMGTATYFYQSYDAWRDTGGKPSSNENAFQNYTASLNPLNIIDWIGAPYLTLAILSPPGESLSNSNNAWVIGYKSTFAGFGEEAFFRGLLYPGIASFFKNKIVGHIFGALVSSAVFSYVNLGLGTFTWREFAVANLLCIQLTINKYDLRHNIFLHSWLNIVTDVKAAGGVGFAFTF